MFPAKLRIEIAALICVKAIALVLIYQLVFAPATRPEPGGQAVLAHILSSGRR